MKPFILNVTLPLKQDPDSQAKIKDFAAKFATDYWPKVKQVLGDSKMVHYARFVVVGTPPKYVQILTEYDTDFRVYTDYFADHLQDFFGAVFGLVEGAPPPGTVMDRETIYKLVKSFDLPCLGDVYFAAYPELTVKEIQQKFGIS
jgi:hypothetical protein